MANIFVLEDDNDLRNLYYRALNFKGHAVVTSDSAEKALELLQNGEVTPDVAVLDMSMPGLPGAVVVDFIRTQSLTPDLPIIVISCDEAFRISLKASNVTFLPKPISLADLYAEVNRAVS